MLDDAAVNAREVAPLLKPLVPGLGAVERLIGGPQDDVEHDDDLDFLALARRETVPARPSRDTATPEQLAQLAVEHGLGERIAELERLALLSVRLTTTPGEAPASASASRLGGLPDLPLDVRWPRWHGEHLPFLAQLDLDEIGPVDDALPDGGVLLFFSAMEDPPSGRLAEDRRSARVIHVPRADVAPPDPARSPRGPTVHTQPVALHASRELVLPGVWSAQAVALGLTPEERAGWDTLRTALAELQGTDEDDEALGALALHRLLGQPDDTDGSLPLVCELVAAGVDVGEAHPDWVPEAEHIDETTLPWRLLLQLSLDDRVDWSWGEGRQRLFFWIEDDALRDGRFGRVLAIAE
jgi:uncharacterized protein YwqG